MKKIRFSFDEKCNEFTLIEEKEGRRTTAFQYYGYDLSPIMEIVENASGRIVEYTNEGNNLAEDYEELKNLLSKNPIEKRFDVPELGLSSASMDEIVKVIYEKYILNKVTAK